MERIGHLLGRLAAGAGVSHGQGHRDTVGGVKAAVLGPPTKHLSLGLSPINPLTWPDGIASAIIETAWLGLPLGPLPCPITGATAPMSLAGALAQQNAEILACITPAQRVRLGLPITYSGRLSLIDPRSGLAVWGGVELGLASPFNFTQPLPALGRYAWQQIVI